MTLTTLSDASLEHALGLRDLSDPSAGPHAMQLIVDSLVETLTSTWGCPALVDRGSPIVSVHQNYERLRYPPHATTRDARYTRYLRPTMLLRSHITAMVPPMLDRLAAEHLADDILLAPVGLVYRRDVIDRLHVGEPHQMDLWRIRRGELGVSDLESMIGLVASCIAPGAAYRTITTDHPYTVGGREISVCVDGKWIEIGECGLVHPEILRDSGLHPDDWSGLAMGIGLDRAVMLRKGLDDIRLLRSADPRVAAQMTNLEPYRPVSRMPAVRRDLSIAATPGTDAEALGDRLREALGERAAAVEDLTILAEARMEDLPPQAIERLGIGPGQTNLLVRLVLRHPTETLTDQAANLLRDDVYALLHQGTVYQWAVPGSRLRPSPFS